MFLTYEDLSTIFSDIMGTKEFDLDYQTVSLKADLYQPKGLYIPVDSTSCDLQQAIANGAVGVVWEKGRAIPKYTPNHFPVFYTDDPARAVKEVFLAYRAKISGKKMAKKDKTNFLFLDEKLLKEFYETYDNAVIAAKFNKLIEQFREEKE
ncbi:hypothetical protein J27TS8_14220 [Robertmurraya siralis]|uniref:Uncharacterized protein n=1 Tax=Robertmurraya siralis TaxID=77777 RepID=A0A920BT44_9BACI|nr:hypothetical protein [Robertmurraya siralis]GIN61429.1 hypothetical protein J27TS8_14220 [Robertmurraya siralis]